MTAINVAITPQSHGAIIGAIPDGADGGNPRGEYAVDLQLDRSDPSQVASGNYSVVGGGSQNKSTNLYSTVAGGIVNQASGNTSTVGGGNANLANGNTSTVAGGRNNQAGSLDATVGGGFRNAATGDGSTIGGGTDNQAPGQNATVGGGIDNQALGQNATVGGGSANKIINNASTNSGNSMISGGKGNQITDSTGGYSMIGWGGFNIIRGDYSTISGGGRDSMFGNIIVGDNSTIGGGLGNQINGDFSTVSGGLSNKINGNYSTVSGGESNSITANYGFCAGQECSLTSDHSVAVGKFNLPGLFTPGATGSDRIFMVGYGDSSSRSNVFSVTAAGEGHFKTSYDAGGADYAEWMESSLDHKILNGTSVVIDNGKIRPAQSNEIPFGVILTQPGGIGNCFEMEWKGKYNHDSDGKIIMESYEYTEEVPKTITKTITQTKLVEKKNDQNDIYYEEQTESQEVQETIYQEYPVQDSNGKFLRNIRKPVMITVTKTGTRQQLNPNFDPTLTYIPRSQRSEWNIVGLLGQIPVRKSSVLNPHWKKLSAINADLDLYFVFPCG